ncbi:MAG: ribonuclease III [Ignavibacteria bacterium]|nr:ribonuclease III [Ignavibacteria bacterium]
MFEIFKSIKKFIPFVRKDDESEVTLLKAIERIDFDKFQKAIHYKIIDKNYFVTALTHRSFLKMRQNNVKAGLISNERLEFFGDSVLDLIVAEFLYKNFPLNEEGDLTKFRSILVNKRFLAERAKYMDLQDYLLASNTALKSIEQGYDSILADAYEAVIGAIFLDSGYEAAKKFLNKEIFAKLDVKWLNQFDDNHKSKFLEYAQAHTDYIPEYAVIDEKGPEHNKLFTVEVYLANNCLGIGKGKSKKKAEQAAAKNALQNLDVIEKMGIKKSKR